VDFAVGQIDFLAGVNFDVLIALAEFAATSAKQGREPVQGMRFS
jgi:hypothetical protein